MVVLKRKNYNRDIFDEKHPNIIYLENPYFDFSSTEIRNRLKKGEDISKLVNSKIKNILLEEGL